MSNLDVLNNLRSLGKSSSEAFNCHNDKTKAEYVADTLISNWRNMNEIAKVNNHKFTAILQPVIYLQGEKFYD